MTEQEFLRQVWRPYDTVIVDGMTGRVTTICFSSRSVKATLSKDVHEWFKYDMIEEHQSIKGFSDDDAIVEDLHNKLIAANKRNEDLQRIVDTQKEKLSNDPSEGLKKLRKFVTEVRDALATKQKRVQQAISAMDAIHKWLDARGIPKAETEELLSPLDEELSKHECVMEHL